MPGTTPHVESAQRLAQLAHELVDRYDQLFFEDLAMKGMQAMWGRKVSDLARSEFVWETATV